VASGPYDQTVGSFCGSTDGQCCQNGALVDPCGPVQIDFVAQTGDGGTPPLTINSSGGLGDEPIGLTARLHTVTPIPMFVSGHNCTVMIDTAPGPTPDVQFGTTLTPITGADVPEVNIGPGQVWYLTPDDFTVGGDATCAANLNLYAVSNMVETVLMNFVNDVICNSCACISL
jgi:hypothetical protein